MSSRFARAAACCVFVAILARPTESALGDGQPYLVKDINPTGFSAPIYLTKVGDRLFFNADDGVHGQELWVSDGTEEGTYMVIDLVLGPDGSTPQRIVDLNGFSLFQADSSFNNLDWYITDGTTAGTVRVGDLHTDSPPISPGCSFRSYYAERAGDVVFFLGEDATHGTELWKTDGTAQGAALLKDIVPGPLDTAIQSLTGVEEMLFFSASGLNLWRSDGTTEGTIKLTTNVGTIGTTDVNGTAFFVGEEATTGKELWVSDGTPEGTHMVKDINPGQNPSTPNYLTNVNGTLYFLAFSPGPGRELWKSDGTEEGTVMVVDLNPSGSSGAYELTNVGGTLFFARFDSIEGWQLWKSDGTWEGTVLVKLIGPTTVSGPEFLTPVNGKLYFSADDGVHGTELWVSDGTPWGTFMIADTTPGPGNHAPWIPVGVGFTLFYAATDGVHGQELWAFDTRDPNIPALSSIGVVVMSAVLLGLGAAIIRMRTAWNRDHG